MNRFILPLFLFLLVGMATAQSISYSYYNTSYNTSSNRSSLPSNLERGADGNFSSYVKDFPAATGHLNYTHNYSYGIIDSNNPYITQIQINFKAIVQNDVNNVSLFVRNTSIDDFSLVEFDIFSTGDNYIYTYNFTTEAELSDIIDDTDNLVQFLVFTQTAQLATLYYGQNITLEYDLGVYNCSSTETPSLELIFRNETDKINMVADFDTIEINLLEPSISNFTFSEENVFNYTLCITPGVEAFTANIKSVYDETDFSKRFHYYDNFELSSTTQTKYLYLLDDAAATQTTFTINDNVGNALQDIVIEAWKYDAGNYTMVAMGRTDSSGTVPIYLQQNEEYEYRLKENGALLKTEETSLLFSATPDAFIITTQVTSLSWSWFNAFDTSCAYNNLTKEMSCTANDNGNITDSWHWRVYVARNGTTGWTGICDEYSTDNPVAFTCDLTGYIEETGSKVYYDINARNKDDGLYYQVVKDYPPSEFFYASGGFGTAGIIIGMLVILMLGLAGSFNPAVALTFMGLGVAVTSEYGLNLLPITYTGFIGIVIVLVTAIYLVKT